jgi:heptosyltransferase-2
VDEVVAVELSRDPESGDERVQLVGGGMTSGPFLRLLSLDDELPLCGLAGYLAPPKDQPGVLSGAYLTEDGRTYTEDVAPWFDMGLLSRFGKQRADQLKLENERSHPAIYADMLGIEMGEPELPLAPASLAFGEAFAAEHGLAADVPWIGLNTGAGGRWESKRLPEERVAAIVAELHRRREGRVGFVLLGGPEERERNDRILGCIGADASGTGARVVDAGTDHALLEFAAIVDRLDLLLTSDSLALHVAVARRVPVVAFFAPTSAAEIELYGRGEKVASTSPDYGSYRRDADTSTLSVERLVAAVLRQLGD